MSGLIEKFLTGPDPSDPYLNNAAFREFARAAQAKSLSKSHAEKEAAVATVNRLVSSFAGVAELQNLEADFEILNIFRDSIPLDFAQVRPLPLGQIPLYRAKSINPVGFFLGSLAGGGGYNYFANKEYGIQVFPFSITTEKVMVPNLNNIYDMAKLAERADALARLDMYQEIGVNNSCINTLVSNPSLVSVVTDDPAVNIAAYAGTGGTFSGKNVYTLDPGVTDGQHALDANWSPHGQDVYSAGCRFG
jgi:hypothetical protein